MFLLCLQTFEMGRHINSLLYTNPKYVLSIAVAARLSSVSCSLQRNTDGSTFNPAKLPTDPVSFVLPSSSVAAPRLTFAAIAAPDLGSRLPKDDPTAPSGTKGQPNLPVSPGQAADAVRQS